MYKGAYLTSKRLTDIVVSVLVLVLASPIILVVSVVIKAYDAGPVFFKQPRSGHGGETFNVFKFRTMSGKADGDERLDTSLWGAGVPEDFVFKTAGSGLSRVTPIGRWLRRSSLDEAPQFLNVLLGQMSLVGPRPEILPITECYTPEQARRLTVKPGITGWAQVTGRSVHNHGQKIAADLYYVENASARLDLWILLRTVWVTLHGRAAY